jgi:hypothetical protein
LAPPVVQSDAVGVVKLFGAHICALIDHVAPDAKTSVNVAEAEVVETTLPPDSDRSWAGKTGPVAAVIVLEPVDDVTNVTSKSCAEASGANASPMIRTITDAATTLPFIATSRLD